jgi:uncharacterized protein YoxC
MTTLVVLTVALIVVVVAVLAYALVVVSRGLTRISAALDGVEKEHLRPLEPAVQAINAQFDIILGALPGIGRKAALVAERRPR